MPVDFNDIDTRYQQSFDPPRPINNTAIRVEQGEYAVLPCVDTRGIGTVNIRQCVVVCGHNPVNGRYGLAHVDGHTEIVSLKPFLEELGGAADNLTLTLLGGGSKELAVGLNLPDYNAHKVKKYLQDEGFKISLDRTGDAHYGIGNKITSDIILSTDGAIQLGIPKGEIDQRLLHQIQAIRRHNGFIGTYPLIPAAGHLAQPNAIMLDKRAIQSLQYLDSHQKQPGSIQNPGQETIYLNPNRFNTTDYRELDAGIEACLNHQQAAINAIASSAKDQATSQTISTYLRQLPIAIGPDAMKLPLHGVCVNAKLREIVELSGSLEDFQIRLAASEELQAAWKMQSKPRSLTQVLSIMHRLDSNLSQDAIIEQLGCTGKDLDKLEIVADVQPSDLIKCWASLSQDVQAYYSLDRTLDSNIPMSKAIDAIVHIASKQALNLDRDLLEKMVIEKNNARFGSKPFNELIIGQDISTQELVDRMPRGLDKKTRLHLQQIINQQDGCNISKFKGIIAARGFQYDFPSFENALKAELDTKKALSIKTLSYPKDMSKEELSDICATLCGSRIAYSANEYNQYVFAKEIVALNPTIGYDINLDRPMSPFNSQQLRETLEHASADSSLPRTIPSRVAFQGNKQKGANHEK